MSGVTICATSVGWRPLVDSARARWSLARQPARTPVDYTTFGYNWSYRSKPGRWISNRASFKAGQIPADRSTRSNDFERMLTRQLRRETGHQRADCWLTTLNFHSWWLVNPLRWCASRAPAEIDRKGARINLRQLRSVLLELHAAND